MKDNDWESIRIVDIAVGDVNGILVSGHYSSLSNIVLFSRPSFGH